MTEKTTRWSIPDRSRDAALEKDAFSSTEVNEDELHAAEAIRNILAISGKNRASALRILLTPLASFCYENGLGVEAPIQLLRAAYGDYQTARSQGKVEEVQ
jgi:hypothetical protein